MSIFRVTKWNSLKAAQKWPLHLQRVPRSSRLCHPCRHLAPRGQSPSRAAGLHLRSSEVLPCRSRQRPADHPSGPNMDLNLPNATVVRGSHHRSPWQRSLSVPVDPSLAGTVQQTPDTAGYFSGGGNKEVSSKERSTIIYLNSSVFHPLSFTGFQISK